MSDGAHPASEADRKAAIAKIERRKLIVSNVSGNATALHLATAKAKRLRTILSFDATQGQCVLQLSLIAVARKRSKCFTLG
jgi:hypothetical protein